jgi:alpha,alpha-trehalase
VVVDPSPEREPGGTLASEGRIPTSRVQAVIFDTDGVVIRTASTHAAAWKAMFDRFLSSRAGSTGEVLAPFTSDDYLRYVDGRARADGVATFLESRGIALERGAPGDDPGCDTIWGLGNRKNELFLARVREGGVGAYASTVALLGRLRSRGIASAAVSASENAGAMLEATGVIGLFDARVDGLDARALGLAGKPDPALFLEAGRRLGIAPADSVVVEDAEAGVEAGRRGGFGLVVGVDRHGAPGGLLRHGADVIVPDLSWFDIDDHGQWHVHPVGEISP